MNKFLTILFVLIFPLYMDAQNVTFRILNTDIEETTDVRIEMMVYCKKKKKIDYESKLAALKTVMFDGCGKGVFKRPLLQEGEITTFQKYPYYIQNLYCCRIDDFISNVKMESEFKRGDNNKGTKMCVVVKAMLLRRDLENNHIITKIGL